MAKDALAKIENKSEEQQPSTPKGGFRGWPRGPRPPLFLWNFVLFLWNALKHKKYLYSWQVSRPSFLDFLDPPLHPLLHPHDPLLTLSKRTWSKFIRVIFIINRLSVFWKDRALIFECLLSDYLYKYELIVHSKRRAFPSISGEDNRLQAPLKKGKRITDRKLFL